jgi:NTE family protein
MDDNTRKRIGIALSGGGYRAAAYHLGTLRALNRLGILDKIDVISSVSGGSITAAYYALHKDDYESFEQSFITKLQKGVLNLSIINLFVIILLIALSVLLFGWWILLLDLGLLFAFNYQLLPFSFWIEHAYNKLFFEKMMLSQLPETLTLAINSTDVATGTLFTFSRLKMAGYSYEGKSKEKMFEQTNFPLARAVMASSCVPFAFSPIKIDKKYYAVPFPEIDKRPLLIDGGLYDNQGTHKLSEKNSSYHTQLIIVSDAGTSEMSRKWAFNIPLMLKKTTDIMMKRIQTFQLRNNLFSHNRSTGIHYAYLALLWDVSDRPIKSFVQNILEGHIEPELFNFHNLKEGDITNLSSEDKTIRNVAFQKIFEQLKRNIGWQELEKVMPTKEEHTIAKSVGTNLTSLKERQIKALIKHSNWLTEVQIRLYLPYIITK